MKSLDDLDTRLLVDLLTDRVAPSKTLGQHYLLDENVIARSVDLVSENGNPLGSDSHVLEIGPGSGSLTLALLRKGARVSAVEIDENSVSHLKRVFGGIDCDLEVIEADALSLEWPTGITHIISNIPYQISSPILEKICSYATQGTLLSAVLLMQDEFASRMSMEQPPYDVGPLGLRMWIDFDIALDRKVPMSSFRPQPRVNSRLVVLTPLLREDFIGLDRSLFKIVTKHCFSNRRRKLRTLLSKPPVRLSRLRGWHKNRWLDVFAELSSSDLSFLPPGWLDLRPENLTEEQWANLVLEISKI